MDCYTGGQPYCLGLLYGAKPPSCGETGGADPRMSVRRRRVSPRSELRRRQDRIRKVKPRSAIWKCAGFGTGSLARFRPWLDGSEPRYRGREPGNVDVPAKRALFSCRSSTVQVWVATLVSSHPGRPGRATTSRLVRHPLGLYTTRSEPVASDTCSTASGVAEMTFPRTIPVYHQKADSKRATRIFVACTSRPNGPVWEEYAQGRIRNDLAWVSTRCRRREACYVNAASSSPCGLTS